MTLESDLRNLLEPSGASEAQTSEEVITYNSASGTPSKGKSLKPDTMFVHKKIPRKALMIFYQYSVVALATTLSLFVSTLVGRMTILSWKCTISSMQLWWNLMPIIPFLIRASALWCSMVSGCNLLWVFRCQKRTLIALFELHRRKDYLY